jgi:hypothetical protein
MAAASWDAASEVRVAPPATFRHSDGQQEGEVRRARKMAVIAMRSSLAVMIMTTSQDNMVVAYDTDDYDASSADYDWRSWVEAMPGPTLLQ